MVRERSWSATNTPLRGIGGAPHTPVSEALLQIRHRGMLARLARVVERERSGAPRV
ncbi:hypothetical protein AB0F20_09640 [Streptomyces goshikiensis]|uniref:hypothetical protein n=1 Tax=Streptomyces goshikiensis TaxID=1942 RepID=UPI00340A239D